MLLTHFKSRKIMNKIITSLAVIAMAVFTMACNADAQSTQNKAVATATKTKTDKIEVLDFHNTHRCRTCLSIEKATREVLEKDFADEMKSGKITFQLINADDDKNLAIIKKFGAFGSSLYLNVWRENEDRAVDLTDFAFMTVGDEAKFKKELREKINAELNKM